jgi:hypothetical protein
MAIKPWFRWPIIPFLAVLLIGFFAIPFSPIFNGLWSKLLACYDLLIDREGVQGLVQASGWAGPLILIALHVAWADNHPDSDIHSTVGYSPHADHDCIWHARRCHFQPRLHALDDHIDCMCFVRSACRHYTRHYRKLDWFFRKNESDGCPSAVRRGRLFDTGASSLAAERKLFDNTRTAALGWGQIPSNAGRYGKLILGS